jgi:hypothetical protein
MILSIDFSYGLRFRVAVARRILCKSLFSNIHRFATRRVACRCNGRGGSSTAAAWLRVAGVRDSRRLVVHRGIERAGTASGRPA